MKGWAYCLLEINVPDRESLCFFLFFSSTANVDVSVPVLRGVPSATLAAPPIMRLQAFSCAAPGVGWLQDSALMSRVTVHYGNVTATDIQH